MAASFIGLVNSGVVTGTESPRFISTFLQPATQYGVDDVLTWVDGFADSNIVTDSTIAARQGQYAIDFYDYYVDELTSGATSADTTLDATDRLTIDQAVAEIIGNPKVPVPQYTDVNIALADTGGRTVIQADGTIYKVPTPAVVEGDGTFRFAPGNKQG
jgi:hypothetical protein